MAISDPQYTSWLSNQSAARCLLVEVVVNVANVETTRYLSTIGYVTLPTDILANKSYLPIISGGMVFSESIELEGSSGVQLGDIELQNLNGEFDTWLDDVWANRQISVFVGDASWARADFRQVFSGIVANIDAKSSKSLNLTITDKLQRLNSVISEVKLGGVGADEDQLIPLTFGEVVNVSPFSSNEPTHEFTVHTSAIEDIIEVRDFGVPVSFTKQLATGKFTLNQNPAGTVTCSVQGDKPALYTNTIADTITRIVKDYGKTTEKFTDTDLDLVNLAAFDVANQQPIGIYINGKENIISVIESLASSVGANVLMSKEGKLRLLQINLPAVGAPFIITPSDMVVDSLSIETRVPVIASVKLGYCKNYTLQTDLQTGIP